MKQPLKIYNDSGMMGVVLLAIVLLHVCQKEKSAYLMAASSFLMMAIPAYSLGNTLFGNPRETTQLDVWLFSNL